MTLKHIKFEDSVTMRSLEKVAREKGWVQSETIEKTASIKKTDYSVTDNLTENVIKLCMGLRNSGFTKYADELEVKFINYKKATNMYDATGEKGKDLVDAAHPHGSHKLEGVEGDSVIETIIDQQLKDVTMVNKSPTGKLSTAEIINQVKLVLGQATEADPNHQINDKIKQFLNIFQRVVNATQDESDFDVQLSFLNIKNWLNNPTLDNLNKTKTMVSSIKDELSPGFLGGISDDTWNRIQGAFDVLSQLIDQMIVLRKSINANAYKEIITEKAPEVKAPAATPVAPEVQALNNAFSDIQKKIVRYKAIVEAKELPNAKDLNNYLDRVNATVNSRMVSFNKQPDANKVEISKYYLDKLNSEIIPGLNAFEGAYVKS